MNLNKRSAGMLIIYISNSDVIAAYCAFSFVFFKLVLILKKITSPQAVNLFIGTGAICEALLKYTKPEKMVNKTLPNFIFKAVIKDLILIYQDNKVVKKKYQL